eukprot:jgi/Botrbrau1/12826/Bobra.20_1s0016.1
MKTDKKTSNPVFDAVAGAASGALARVVVGPLDVVKIRLQVQLEPVKAGVHSVTVKSKYTGFTQALCTIFREEGVRGLWRGTVPGLLLTVPYTSVQFAVLQQLHSAADRAGLQKGKWATSVSFLSGAGAGAAATIASYPFDLLRTTLAAQGEPKVYRGLGDAARGIVHKFGIKGLYRGMGATLVEIIPYAAVQFGMYDVCKSMYRSRFRKDGSQEGESGLEAAGRDLVPNFICGFASGTLAKLCTHPLDVAKKRFQIAGLERAAKYGANVPVQFGQSLPKALMHIWRVEGLRGMYKGALPSVLKAAPQAAVTLTTYHFFLVVISLLQTRQPVPPEPKGPVAPEEPKQPQSRWPIVQHKT